MKKLVLFFVSLIIFSFCGAVMAQAPDLPAIDPEIAEPYLGTWHLDKMCEAENCMPTAAFGLDAVLEIKEDNTLVMTFGDEEPDISYWYMEDGTAYMAGSNEEDQAPIAILINEDNNLEIGQDGTSMFFTRSGAVQWGSAEVKSDAEFKDFEGDWYLESLKVGDMFLPAGLLENRGKLTIREDSLDLVYSDEAAEQFNNIPYELKDGTITAEYTDNEQIQKVQLQYHIDDSVVISIAADDGTGADMVFVREENLTEIGMSLTDLFAIENAE